MASVFDEYAEEVAQERAKETAIRFIREGVSIEIIAKAIPSLSIDEIKQLEQQELANA